jgi:5'-nucleotidase
MLHGVDVIAPKVFSGRPDLVISGPNEGNNLGLITPHSGTLGAAVAALNKNIPAIAVSADRNDHTQEEADLIAALTLKVVAAVDGRHGVRLPRGTGLNVNIPDVDPATAGADDFKFRQTRVGLASNAGLQFYERLGDSPIAQSQLPESYWDFPGLSVEIPYTLAGHPQDNSRKSEANVVGDLTVSVSPIQGTYAADRWKEYAVRHSLRNLFHSRH